MGYDLFEELQKKMGQLDISLKSLRENGIKYAEAESNYKQALNKKVLELDAEGKKATIINLTIYGYKDIAALRLTRDSMKVIYEANVEALNVLKIEIKVLQNQIDKEWGNS